MKVIYGLNRINKFRKPVVALGVFDGVHQAHRRILSNTVARAHRIKGRSVVVTFWPHPQRKNSIYSLEHRLRLISQIGIDICIVIRFNRVFSQIKAEDFIKNILVDKIGADYIYVGKNFRFGKGASGDYKTLNRLSARFNFKLKVFNVLKINKQPISSTYIRALIMKGNLNLAQKLLARPVSVLGTVIKGGSLGRHLGFPTANIDPHHEVLPPSGIYAVKIIFNNKTLRGVCYIGTRPTFENQKSKHVEVYIFNFNKNIYGRYLEIQFIKKIREDKKFSTILDLAEQIKKDITASQKIFSHH